MIRAFAARGWRVLSAGGPPPALLRLTRRCSRRFTAALRPEDLAGAGGPVLDALERVVRSEGVDLVVPGDVAGAFAVHALKPRLPGTAFFPSPDPDTLRMMDDKWAFHRFLLREGLPSPETLLLEDAEQARRAPLPAVLKPLAMSGSIGVTVVRTPAEREAALAATAALRLPALSQAYLEGPDVDLSLLADRGRLVAWAIQTRRPDGSFDFIEEPRVLELGRRLAAACSYTGLAHLDMRYEGPDRSAVRFIECNPRFWGSFHFADGLGAGFIERGLELAAGESPRPAPAPLGHCPGMGATVRSLLRGRPTSAAERTYLLANLTDPLPDLYKAAVRLAGSREPLY